MSVPGRLHVAQFLLASVDSPHDNGIGTDRPASRWSEVLKLDRSASSGAKESQRAGTLSVLVKLLAQCRPIATFVTFLAHP